MTGWEVIIFLFGGAWYVISAIAAAKDKKKKKEAREAAMMAEVRQSPEASKSSTPEPAASKPGSEGMVEILSSAKVRQDDLVKPEEIKSPSPSTPVQVQAGTKPQPSMVQDARKAILDAMRKEMGLGSSSTTKPSAPVETAPLQVPARTSSATSGMRGPAPTPGPRPSAERRKREQELAAEQARNRPAAQPQIQPASSIGPVRGQSIRNFLHSPGSLQKAMVLTEVFGPPVTLRENHLGE